MEVMLEIFSVAMVKPKSGRLWAEVWAPRVRWFGDPGSGVGGLESWGPVSNHDDKDWAQQTAKLLARAMLLMADDAYNMHSRSTDRQSPQRIQNNLTRLGLSEHVRFLPVYIQLPCSFS